MKVVLVKAALAALVALSFGPVSQSLAAPAAAGKVVRTTLIDENGSGEDGSAQLTDLGDGTTKVELIMMNAPEGAVQPAHIHKGTCANLDPSPAYPLSNITEGKSETVVKAPLADLLKEKYAVNVHKSATEAAVYVSCGNLPQAADAASMTMEQALAKLVDDATELLGTVKKQESDASKNAYDIFHGTFAAHENEIKAKDAALQTRLEDAMHGVRDAVNAGKWEDAEKAGETLVAAAKEAQTKLAGPSTATSTAASNLAGSLQKLSSATGDLIRETTNKDKEGAQRAYDDFHTTFAAVEGHIKARDAEGQEHIEAAMHEVRDALAAGDFTKALTASKELQNEVADVSKNMPGNATAGESSTLPEGGVPETPWLPLSLLGATAALVLAGSRLRRVGSR